MKQELVRFNSSDNLGLTGVLYKPLKETTAVVVHVHGKVGFFYEGYTFHLAEAFTKKGYAFLSFNTRGTGYFTDFIKKEKEKFRVEHQGSAYELFSDSIFDIDGAFNFLQEQGYSD